MSLFILCITFVNPEAGFSGMIAAATSVFISVQAGLNRYYTQEGFLSFNSLLTGIALGTFYETGSVFFVLLITTAIINTVMSVVLSGVLGKYGLPFMSLPFVFTMWLILSSTPAYSALGLSQKSVYWINEMYATGGLSLVDWVTSVDTYPLPLLLNTYLRALSSIFFQSNILSGAAIALALLIYSRIAFSLTIVAFFTAYYFNLYTGAYEEGLNYYNLGSNYMMIAVAIGGYFSVPSVHSYLWAVLSVPVSAIIITGTGKMTGTFHLPAFSLPFCLSVLMFLYFTGLRQTARGLSLTPVQYASPERNLYEYLSGLTRFRNHHYFRFQLPFLGKWKVTQGYNGAETHKGDWSQALDFMIQDDTGKTWQNKGSNPEDFYCYNKPVLACADGIVEEVINHIPDNAIGDNNTENNWGNSVVIKHLPGLYSKVSHLRQGSISVNPGDYVQRGTILGSCGNSGRSAEPHIHFQLQTTPYIGSKTLEYPISIYILNGRKKSMKVYETPTVGQEIMNPEQESLLYQTFRFLPGSIYTVSDGEHSETWEVLTDAYNYTYIYCRDTGNTAYFTGHEYLFTFTSYRGSRNSLLYTFYISLYRVIHSYTPDIPATDSYPLSVIQKPLLIWAQDVIAPFIRLISAEYILEYISRDDEFSPGEIRMKSQMIIGYGKIQMKYTESMITVQQGGKIELSVRKGKKQQIIRCEPSYS